MEKIQYLIGDATDPHEVDDIKIIIHISNDQGAWGAGFVMALSKRWHEPESIYRKIAENGLVIGDIQIIQVSHNIFVVNMVAQTLGWKQDARGKMTPPIDYDGLRECLSKVCCFAQAVSAAEKMPVNIVGPRFGAGLAGGQWEKIEKLVQIELCKWDIPVYIYDLPDSSS